MRAHQPCYRCWPLQYLPVNAERCHLSGLCKVLGTAMARHTHDRRLQGANTEFVMGTTETMLRSLRTAFDSVILCS